MSGSLLIVLKVRRLFAVQEGLYTATEYDLAMLPDEILRQSVAVGRACIARRMFFG